MRTPQRSTTRLQDDLRHAFLEGCWDWLCVIFLIWFSAMLLWSTQNKKMKIDINFYIYSQKGSRIVRIVAGKKQKQKPPQNTYTHTHTHTPTHTYTHTGWKPLLLFIVGYNCSPNKVHHVRTHLITHTLLESENVQRAFSLSFFQCRKSWMLPIISDTHILAVKAQMPSVFADCLIPIKCVGFPALVQCLIIPL